MPQGPSRCGCCKQEADAGKGLPYLNETNLLCALGS